MQQVPVNLLRDQDARVGADLAAVLEPVDPLGQVVYGAGRAVEQDGPALLHELGALQLRVC